MKNYSGWIIAKNSWAARHPDGRHAMQVMALVRAPNRTAAARAAGATVHHLKTYWSETGSPSDIALLDAHPPLTLIVRPMDTHGTVAGARHLVVTP